jgi:antagonist of KipI
MRIFQLLMPGLFTTVQDLGRYGYLRYGVPISGAMDTFSLVAANSLVGNSLNDACLEITLVGPELQALARTQIALTGGDISPRINDKDVSMWQTLTVQEGDVVSFGKMKSGCRAYVSIRGGIDAPIVLGSKSTYVRGSFGGISGRQLKTGDIIEGSDTHLLNYEYLMPEESMPQLTDKFRANVILGPQADMFTDSGIDTLLSNSYRVALEADRMGYRLQGPTIEHKAKADIVSDALLPGSVQVPKNGQPILIMRDAQTTGGYAKIAVVISSDLDMLGQAKPKDPVEFVKTTTSQAYASLIERQKRLSSLSNVLIRKTTVL